MALSVPFSASGDEALLDFYDQVPRIVVPGEGLPSEEDLQRRRQPDYRNNGVRLRFDNVRAGSFSLELVEPGAVTLLASVWGSRIDVPSEAVLEFWLAPLENAEPPAEVEAALLGGDRRETAFTVWRVEEESGWWRYEGALPDGAPESTEAVTLKLAGIAGNSGLLLDGVILRGRDQARGITDKPLEQWMLEAKETRAGRIQAAMQEGTQTDRSGEFRQWFDKLFLGREVEESNRAMKAFLQDELERIREEKTHLWDLALNVRLIQAYYELGSKSGRDSVALAPETESLLLEVLWERTKEKNDIGWASSNTWWMTGSENHDLNAKAASLVSSRIFMNEPEYRDRLYPDAARAPGHGYWFHLAFRPHGGGQESGYGPERSAPWGFSGRHTAAEHYEAWVAYFHRYFAGRAKRGFFLENASAGYMKWTLGFLHNLHAYGGDQALREKTGAFFDLVWADWAQEQISGLRGGGKTRHHGSVGGYDSMTVMSRFLLGGPGTTQHIYTSMLLDDYVLPPVVFDMALDSRGRGTYAIVARGIGEEETTRPRPEGTERTLTTDTEARFLKYSWVTPHYILGTQMDHPEAVHSHLSARGRWHGLIVAGSPEARIVPTGADEGRRPDMEVVYSTVQYKNVLVGQQARRWMEISPTWFPATPMYEKEIVLHVGGGWEEIQEEAGWLFLRKGAAYAAVREFRGKRSEEPDARSNYPFLDGPDDPNLVQIATASPQWTEDRRGIHLENKFSPFVIHAGSAGEHGNFDAFLSTVLSSQVELRKTVVPGFFILAYRGQEAGAPEIVFYANAPEIPRIGGKPVEYRPAALFDSPFLESEFGSGKHLIRKGTREMRLKFDSRSDEIVP